VPRRPFRACTARLLDIPMIDRQDDLERDARIVGAGAGPCRLSCQSASASYSNSSKWCHRRKGGPPSTNTSTSSLDG